MTFKAEFSCNVYAIMQLMVILRKDTEEKLKLIEE